MLGSIILFQSMKIYKKPFLKSRGFFLFAVIFVFYLYFNGLYFFVLRGANEVKKTAAVIAGQKMNFLSKGWIVDFRSGRKKAGPGNVCFVHS